MSFNAKDQTGGGNFVDVPALEEGSYPARVVQLILMGLQPQRPYQGQVKEPKEMLYVGYELSHEFMKDDDGKPDLTKPRWVGEDFPFYNLEADRATSTLRYNAIDGKGEAGGDWLKVLGMPCVVTLSKEPRKNREGSFANYVQHVGVPTKMPGYTQPDLVNPHRVFDIEEPDMEVFKKLPKWIQTKLTSNLNYQGSALQKAVGEAPDEPPTSPPPTPIAVAVPIAPPAPPMPNAAAG